jgi:ArsR family transcriptional regulator, arsenate/arsenite/antimonite-responsive transcriptional repressor
MVGAMAMQAAYRALSDPTRREILRILREGEMPAGEIAAHFDMAFSSVSRHLGLLTAAGLVRPERDGGRVIYSLTTSVLADVVLELADLAGVGTNVDRAALIDPVKEEVT